MTERKPSDVGFETWVDEQIRTAQERGDFDNLSGAGRPLRDLDKPYDELWWVKDYLRREGLPTDVLLPTSLRLRGEIERLPDTVRDLPTERAVRDAVRKLNLRIAQWLRAPSGPQVPVRPVNPGDVVARWRTDRRVAAGTTTPAARGGAALAPAPAEDVTSRQGRWWRRIARRRGM